SPNALYVKKNSTTDPTGIQFYGLNEQQTRLGVVYSIDLSADPIDLNIGTEFSFDISTDGTVFQGWEMPALYNVNLILVDASAQYANISAGISLNGSDAPNWQHLTFDFTGYEHLTQIVEFRIVVSKSNGNWANTYPGFYFDNIQREVLPHQKMVENPQNYRVTNGDVLIAKVLNYFDLGRVDYAEATIGVVP